MSVILDNILATLLVDLQFFNLEEYTSTTFFRPLTTDQDTDRRQRGAISQPGPAVGHTRGKQDLETGTTIFRLSVVEVLTQKVQGGWGLRPG